MTLYKFTNGTSADADEVNDNFDGVVLRRKRHSYATQVNFTTGSYVEATNFTITAPVGSLIIGLQFECEFKDYSTGTTSAILKIDGTNLGSKYLENGLVCESVSGGFFIGGTESYTFATTNNNYCDFTAYTGGFLELLDTTTTISVLGRNSAPSNGYIRNIVVNVLYISSFIEA